MGMTLVEKILGKAAGESFRLQPDLSMINDGEGYNCLDILDKSRGIARKDKVVVILDHDIPAGTFDSAANQKRLIEFSQENDLSFIQSEGIGYQILLDRYVKPGDVIVSCGTHNSFFGAKGALGLNLNVKDMATLLTEESLEMKVPETVNIVLKGVLAKGVYAIDFILKMISEMGSKGVEGMVVEFTGEGVKNLSLNDKIVLCSMATQTGAVSALINENPEGNYVKTYEYDLSETSSTVTLPGDLYTAKPVEDLKGVAVSAGFIGGCMGGRIEDLRIAAEILKGKRIKVGVRAMIGAATNAVFLQAIEEGLIDIFFDAGVVVNNTGCGSCKTSSIGVVGDGEVLITTGSHNYSGCSGTVDSKVYIASAATVAKAFITGYICE